MTFNIWTAIRQETALLNRIVTQVNIKKNKIQVWQGALGASFIPSAAPFAGAPDVWQRFPYHSIPSAAPPWPATWVGFTRGSCTTASNTLQVSRPNYTGWQTKHKLRNFPNQMKVISPPPPPQSLVSEMSHCVCFNLSALKRMQHTSRKLQTDGLSSGRVGWNRKEVNGEKVSHFSRQRQAFLCNNTRGFDRISCVLSFAWLSSWKTKLPFSFRQGASCLR